MKTRAVDKYLFKNYIKKAQECFDTMIDAFKNERWNATVINAIHCAISASDALSVFFKGVRSAGEKHEDAISLLQIIEIDSATLKNKTRQLGRLISIKNAAEYEERLMTQNDAEQSVKDAERFFAWVKKTLEM